MRSSKKRKIGDRPMKRFTADLELDVYAKLSKLAGPESLSATMTLLIERRYEKALLRQSAQVSEIPLKTQ